jgi:RimJ/RimL family protein N-acetyltransferase
MAQEHSFEDDAACLGVALPDAALVSYVRRIDFGSDSVFGVCNDHLALVGVVHVARRVRMAELGLSMLAAQRGHGVGQALFRRAHTHARNMGAPSLYMHCMTENKAVMHIARKAGLQLVHENGESDAYLRLSPADASSHFDEALCDGVALLDTTLSLQRRALHSPVRRLAL